MSRQARPAIVRGTVVDVEAFLVKLQADRLLEHDPEGAGAAHDWLTTAIAQTRDSSPWRHADPPRLRKATDGDLRCGRRLSFFSSNRLPLHNEKRRGNVTVCLP